MADKREIAESLYRALERGTSDDVLSILSERLSGERTEKLHLSRTPVLVSIGRELGKLLSGRAWKFDRFRELWKLSYSRKQLLAQGLVSGREVRLIIIGALGVFSKKEYESTKSFVLDMADTIQDWETCDQMALRVMVNLAIQNRDEILAILRRWLHSGNKWVRRLAIATIPPYIRAREEEADTCLEIIGDAMEEEDREVRKAIGWALREVSKKDWAAVFEFLRRWAADGDRNTMQIIKDGMKKLPKEKQDELRQLMGN